MTFFKIRHTTITKKRYKELINNEKMYKQSLGIWAINIKVKNKKIHYIYNDNISLSVS